MKLKSPKIVPAKPSLFYSGAGVVPLIFSLIFLSLFFPSSINAETFSSTNFRIEMGGFNVTSGKKSSTNYRLTDTVGQLAPGQFSHGNYIVKSGFQYIYGTLREFTFSIDYLTINLGTLVPMVGSTASNIITISSPYGTGYQVYASQNQPLTNYAGSTIPDTICNVGSTCTETASGVWTETNRYGFGFNAIGIDTSGVATGVGTSNYFPDNTYYRHFANQSASENPAIIMSESTAALNRRARISYKALISSVQTASTYQNAITFSVIPQY